MEMTLPMVQRIFPMAMVMVWKNMQSQLHQLIFMMTVGISMRTFTIALEPSFLEPVSLSMLEQVSVKVQVQPAQACGGMVPIGGMPLKVLHILLK